jgi:hypothetical protein
MMEICSPAYVENPHNVKRFDLYLRASPNDVFDVLVGKDEDCWFPHFVSLRWLVPAGAGAVREYRTKSLTLLEHFTVWEPGRRLVFYLSKMSIPYCSRFMEHYEIEQLDDGTSHVIWRICWQYSPLFRLVGPLLRRFFESDFREAAANLEAYFRGERPIQERERTRTTRDSAGIVRSGAPNG